MTASGDNDRALIPAEERPSFSAEELELLDDDAAITTELDVEDIRAVERMRKLGFDDEAIGRLRGRSVEDITRPAPTLRSIEKEIDEVRALRKSDSRKYWSAETQEHEAALIAQRERLRAEDAPAETGDQDGEVGADLPQELQERWRKSGPKGVKGAIAAARSRVILAVGEDGLQAEDMTKLMSSFDEQLSDDIRVEVADQLAQDHGGSWPAATDAQLQDFGQTEWGKGLLETWGDKAAKHLGAAQREARAIEMRLGERQRQVLNGWVNSKSATQKRRMIEMLAARARARL